jgi:hypothetical protein
MAGRKMVVVAEVAVGGRIMAAAMFLNGNGLAGPTSIRASRCPCLGLRLQPNSAIALLRSYPPLLLATLSLAWAGHQPVLFRKGPLRPERGLVCVGKIIEPAIESLTRCRTDDAQPALSTALRANRCDNWLCFVI